MLNPLPYINKYICKKLIIRLINKIIIKYFFFPLDPHIPKERLCISIYINRNGYIPIKILIKPNTQVHFNKTIYPVKISLGFTYGKQRFNDNSPNEITFATMTPLLNT